MSEGYLLCPESNIFWQIIATTIILKWQQE